MRVFAFAFAGVMSQDPMPSLPPLPTDPTPVPTMSSTTTTTPADKVTREERCGNLPYHFQNGPEPTGKDLCPSYSCYSCCDDAKVSTEFNKFKNVDGKLTKYGIFDFSGCDAQGNKVQNAGMSSTCQAYVQSNFCTSQCSPNIYAFQRNQSERVQIQACRAFCQSFLEACQNDYICFNPEGLGEYLNDLYYNGGVVDGKDYLITRCEKDYDCIKISESFIANKPDLGAIPDGPLKQKLKEKFDEVPKEPSSARFCDKFTSGLFRESNDDNICVDPRQETSIIKFIKDVKEPAYNKAHPDAPVNFPVSEPCPTGLSTGAIVGIVIGCLVGVGLIAGLVYYFVAGKGGNDDGNGDYNPGKQSSGSMVSESTRQNEDQTEMTPTQAV
ncbi:Oidioi.mRNA.OKI2018_I69.PAR.g9246.t1.cds [Oikopleura dioica]|uniref:Oidioi.mRNA.OKI2018_I69.PAR.g9246.t1.cds n=1 Tax=Oikopleura dioica TaxID=34765 RepID=A0ABN7RQ70_OIKDI|nr:Oidioi.mRNA.OKI2018_I69.PAR.g9246.t1.cds [Oikopleura dioica]